MGCGATHAAEAEALKALAEHGYGRLDHGLVERAQEVRQLAAERFSRSTDHVTVALAGGTGSGKSSLFNALTGTELATVGVRRPTTAEPQAVVIGDGPERADTLLDWLKIDQRHHAADEHLAGAVVVDLPDIDSVEQGHWLTAERLIDRTDLLVWVLDPLKYAHAVTHERYFSRLARHAEVLFVALNHADRLAPEELDTCLEHLRSLLAAQGLAGARLFATSALDGQGVGELTEAIRAEVRARTAPAERLRADAATLLDEASAQLPQPEQLHLDERALLSSLTHAVAEPQLSSTAHAEYRRMALRGCRSPARRLVSWVIGVLVGAVRTLGDTVGLRSEPAKLTAPVSANAVRRTLLEAVAPLVRDLPDPAAHRLTDVAEDRASAATTTLRRHVDGVALRPPSRTWWTATSLLRGVAQLAATIGLVWLAAAGAVLWLALPPLPMPNAAGDVPWPTALLLGGVLVSLLLGGVARLLTGVAARRHAAHVSDRLREAIRLAVEESLEPLHDEVAGVRALAWHAHRWSGPRRSRDAGA